MNSQIFSLAGKHQIDNAATAISVIKSIKKKL